MNHAPTTVAFRATIELGGKTATGIEVPDDAVAALGSSRRPAVRATIQGYAYRTSVVLSIEDAKTPETRQRRIAKAVASLLAEAA